LGMTLRDVGWNQATMGREDRFGTRRRANLLTLRCVENPTKKFERAQKGAYLNLVGSREFLVKRGVPPPPPSPEALIGAGLAEMACKILSPKELGGKILTTHELGDFPKPTLVPSLPRQ